MRIPAVALLLALVVGCGSERPAVLLHAEDAIPVRLSDWGILVREGGYLALNENVIPYDLNMPLFSDYALKLRTIWVPPGTTISYAEDRELEFPVGTIISKTFHYEKGADWTATDWQVVRVDRSATLDQHDRLDLDNNALLETRLLVRYESGWKGFPYVWNNAQDEAWLEIAGSYKNLRFHDADDEFVYIVPDTNQCGGCHTPDHSAKELRPIGPKAWQLNRPFEYDGINANQLERWSESGLLVGLPEVPPTGARWSHPDDYSIEELSRAYLDSNCAHCHNAKGAADTSALHLNKDAPLDRHYGFCKPPVAVGRGSGDRPYDIYPGRPDDSILVFRLQHTDPAIAMPELGRSTVHAEGVALITRWIESMPGDC